MHCDHLLDFHDYIADEANVIRFELKFATKNRYKSQIHIYDFFYQNLEFALEFNN